jgi:hypothetical protein
MSERFSPRPEQSIHHAVADHLRQRGATGLVWWHTANGMFAGGKRSGKGIAIQAAIMKGLGMRAGVADIIAVHQGKIFALELKTDGGRTSEAQKQFLADMKNAGAHVEVALGLDNALAVLERWQLLRGTAQ